MLDTYKGFSSSELTICAPESSLSFVSVGKFVMTIASAVGATPSLDILLVTYYALSSAAGADTELS